MSQDLLQNIYLSSLTFLNTINLEERYSRAVEEAVKITDSTHGTIFLIDHNKDLNRVYSTVPSTSRAKPRAHGNTIKAALEEKLLIIQGSELKKAHKNLYTKGIKSLILIPLSFHKKTIGVLSLQSHDIKHFSKEMEHALQLFGSMLSLGIHNSQLYEQSINALESRDLFISLAAHELRTPLTTISAYADQIEKRVNKNILPTPKSIKIVRSEAKRLRNIINELLAIDQVKTGQLRYSWDEITLLSVLKKAIINFKINYPTYRVLIEKHTHKKAILKKADADKLQQVFTNLLNNAAKFSSPSTPIVLSISGDEKFCKISITDYGKGIRKKEQSRVFTEFFKAEGNHKEGMGLGLFLVKNIINKHKGNVSMSSKLNEGTTVTVTLPKI